ncbi:MAG: serine/threonine-protein kinase [Myxococcota bacterium]
MALSTPDLSLRLSDDGSLPPADPASSLPDDDGKEPIKAGDTLAGRYELVAPIGRGGMGAVWRGYDHRLQTDVAIKLLRGSAHPQAMARLLREARAAARIRHPGVVRALDVGAERGFPFIVMELVAGPSLEEHLDDVGRLWPEEAVDLVLPLLRCLAVAHECGVVHRDIKPSNIMLVDVDGAVQPRLLDFGIVRLTSDDKRLTKTGQLLGTPFYMSYEQASGSTDIDARSDVWAVCVLLYEMIAGVGPFDGENYNSVLTNILMCRQRRLDDVVDDVDAPLADIVAMGLETDRERRWSTARELEGALRAWRHAAAPFRSPQRPVPPAREVLESAETARGFPPPKAALPAHGAYGPGAQARASALAATHAVRPGRRPGRRSGIDRTTGSATVPNTLRVGPQAHLGTRRVVAAAAGLLAAGFVAVFAVPSVGEDRVQLAARADVSRQVADIVSAAASPGVSHAAAEVGPTDDARVAPADERGDGTRSPDQASDAPAAVDPSPTSEPSRVAPSPPSTSPEPARAVASRPSEPVVAPPVVPTSPATRPPAKSWVRAGQLPLPTAFD